MVVLFISVDFWVEKRPPDSFSADVSSDAAADDPSEDNDITISLLLLFAAVDAVDDLILLI